MHRPPLLLLMLAGALTISGCATATSQSFRPARWCAGRHLQTICGGARPAPRAPIQRTRWELPDGDFLDIDEMTGNPAAPLLIVLHGLESSSNAGNVRGLLNLAHQKHWGGLAINFRSCGGELNRLSRSYHGGDTADLAWVIDQVTARDPARPIVLVGLSLGGNVLLKYLGERGERLPEQILAAVAISTPFDLAISAHTLEQGFNKIYMARMVRSLKHKTRAKLEQFPNLVDRDALLAVKTMVEFDDLVTAPLHAFANAQAYWTASSSAQFLPTIKRPTLLINAQDDPLLPAEHLPRPEQINNPFLTMEFPSSGGHLGFISGGWPWRPTSWAEHRAIEFLSEHTRGRSDS